VTDSLQSRLDRLEILYREQDYTIQLLNNTISDQDREISRLTLSLEQFRLQLQALRSELTSDIDPSFEQPPHY
jgi:uncharacterized coiled-coil protein SlyX